MKPGDAEYDALVARKLSEIRGNVTSEKMTEEQTQSEIKAITGGAISSFAEPEPLGANEGVKSCPQLETEALRKELRDGGLLPKRRGRPPGSKNRTKQK